MANVTVFTMISLLAVLPTVNQKELTKDFSCCELPYKIPLEPTNDYEFAIGNETLAIAAGSTFAANPPFAILGNTTLIQEECKSFVQRTIFKNKFNKTDETIMHHISHPCNATPPDDQQQGHTSTGAIVGVVLAVVVGVIVAIVIIVFYFKKTRNTGAANDVI